MWKESPLTDEIENGFEKWEKEYELTYKVK
jgi:hypothetical protein